MPITAKGRWFIDETGRTRILHGLNLSGSSKVPADPPGNTHLPESLDETRPLSFVGRPFPLDEADEHFTRIKHWGLDFLRFIVTWEAIEHAGPGSYDEAYLDYLQAVLEKALEYEIQVFIDPHQDVWSRFCGGDGAPAWTLEAAGMDVSKLHETGAALLHQTAWRQLPPADVGEQLLSLRHLHHVHAFLRRQDFRAKHAGRWPQHIQDYLQAHYTRAYAQVARRIGHLPNVLGFGVMNEPHFGLIGVPDLRSHDHLIFQRGVMPSPAQAIFLANGFAQDCPDFGSPLPSLPRKQESAVRIDPQGA